MLLNTEQTKYKNQKSQPTRKSKTPSDSLSLSKPTPKPIDQLKAAVRESLDFVNPESDETKLIKKAIAIRLPQIIKRSPQDFSFAYTCWTLGSLAIQIKSEFGIKVSLIQIKQILNAQKIFL